MSNKNGNQGVIVNGGSLIANDIVVGKHSTINKYNESASRIQELKEEFDNLQQEIYSLRQAVESDLGLSQAQRQAAKSDLASFSEEIKKPLSEQDFEIKKFFWSRFSETVKFSAALMSLSSTVAKLTGLI